MKCPKCWAEKAWSRNVPGLRGSLLAVLMVVPMRCGHCYHKFHVPWFYTIGRQIHPPALAMTPPSPPPRYSVISARIPASAVRQGSEALGERQAA